MDAVYYFIIFCFVPLIIIVLLMLYFGLRSYDIERFLIEDEKKILEAEVMASIRSSFFTMKGYLHLTNTRIIFRPKNIEYFPWMAITRIGWIYKIDLSDIEKVDIEPVMISKSKVYKLIIKSKAQTDSFLLYTIGDQRSKDEEIDKWKKSINKYRMKH